MSPKRQTSASDDAIDQDILDHALSYVSIELETSFLDGTYPSRDHVMGFEFSVRFRAADVTSLWA